MPRLKPIRASPEDGLIGDSDADDGPQLHGNLLAADAVGELAEELDNPRLEL